MPAAVGARPEQVVLAEHPLGQETHQDPHLGAGHRPPGGGEGALGHPLADAGGERLEGVAEAAEVGVDPLLAVEDEGPGRVVRRDGEAGELPDELFRPGRDHVELRLQGRRQIRRFERVVAGDAPRQALGQPPVDRFRSGARGAQVDFLPTLTPYFSMRTLTTYPRTIISISPTKLRASTGASQ